MNKIKNLLSKLSQELKDLMKKFPITMSIIIFLTLLFTSITDQNFSRNIEDILEKIEIFCLIWAVGTFFTETFFENKIHKIISYVLTGIVSFIFIRLTYATLTPNIANLFEKILVTYIAVLILISIYKTIKNNQLTLEQYLIGIFRDLFNMSIIYVILNIGFVLIVEIFNLLILDGSANMGIIRILILLYGLFYVPSILYSVSAVNKKEINSFIKGLVRYVFLPLVSLAMAIIYLYIAKILILRDMPKNVIFRILAGIFIVGFPVWNMASCYDEEKKWIGKITNILPVLYVPFIFLEMYAIGVRIGEFGITPMRYVSCAFIVFQIICLSLTFYKNKEKLSLVLVCIAIMVFIIVLTPFGYENVSNLSQKKILERLLPENADFALLSDAEKAKVRGAYKYLKGEINSEKYIPNYLTEEVITQINAYNKKEKNYYNKYFYHNKELDLDIDDYSRVRKIAGMSEENDEIELDEINLQIDFSDFVACIMKQNEVSEQDAEDYFEENNLVKINEFQDIYVENISLQYDSEQKIDYFRIQGYLLEK